METKQGTTSLENEFDVKGSCSRPTSLFQVKELAKDGKMIEKKDMTATDIIKNYFKFAHYNLLPKVLGSLIEETYSEVLTGHPVYKIQFTRLY